MAISFNNSANPTAVTFNGNTVNEVIFNGVTVWTASVLPSAYRQLEYVESSGTQWIDTGVNGGTKPEYELKFNNLGKSPQNYYMYFGGTGKYQNTNTPKIFMYAWSSDTQGRYGYVMEDANIKLFYTNSNNNTVELKNGDYYVNGSLVGSYNFNQGWSYPGYNVWIFNNARENIPATMRLFYCKMWTDGVLVRDYIPVEIKATGEAGLYDLVTKQFYGNVGTGSFIAGPEKYDDDYQMLNYIESTSASSNTSGPHIVLDVYGDEVDKFDIKARWYTIPTNRSAGAMMYEELNASPWNGIGVRVKRTNGNLSFKYGSSGPEPITGTSNTINKDLEIIGFGNASSYTINGTTYNHTPASSPSHYLVTIFCENNGGSYIYHTNGRLYYVKLYNSNGDVIRNLLPAKRIADNAIGLYDTVTKTFYVNSGSGSFNEG